MCLARLHEEYIPERGGHIQATGTVFKRRAGAHVVERKQAGRSKGRQHKSGQAACAGEAWRTKFPRGGRTVLVFMGASGREQRPCPCHCCGWKRKAQRLWGPKRRGGSTMQVLGSWNGLRKGVSCGWCPAACGRGPAWEELGGEGAPAAAVGAQLTLPGGPQQWRRPLQATSVASRAVRCTHASQRLLQPWQCRAFKLRTVTAGAGA